MKIFATDLEKLSFLLETDAALAIDPDQPGGSDAEEEKHPKYITNYIGSKQKLADWIWSNTHDTVSSVFDAFSGSAVVAYMYKSKGMHVFTNDRLHYCHHTAKAIIENSSILLSETDIEQLLTDNPKAKTFVQDNFKGIFFAKGIHALIDSVRANCDKLSGYKKDIALFALGKTCISGKGGFGHFSSSTDYGRRQDSPEEFRKRLKANIERINALVFDNGKENKAYCEDINEILPKVKADLAYFDPPYATEFSTTNYEKAYHFIEGLMTYWDGLTIKTDTKVKNYETDHMTVTKGNASEFFKKFLCNAEHIPHWLISYRDHAYPNEQQMKKIIGESDRQSRMKSKDHKYSITSKHGEASNAKERLFICVKNNTSHADAEKINKPLPMAAAANFHISIPVEVYFNNKSGLNTLAMSGPDSDDPQFPFILCRTGTNLNGDHFTAEELSERHMTAINRKIDLQHSQSFSDIVGGILASDYLEDEKGGRVECIGELYTKDTPHAQLAYKLMKRGIISQVSMECDYEEGECSICKKRFKSKSDYCTHLRKFKGRELDGKPVFEILHGVTFTGMGLLDRKGADENAKILQVASVEHTPAEQQDKGDPDMDKEKKPDESIADAAKEKQEQGKTDTDPEKENRELKAKITALQKRIYELEAEQKAAAAKSRAHKLITELEKHGMDFGETRDDELKRLTELSDDAFAATEAAYEKIGNISKTDDRKNPDSDKDPDKTKAKASAETPVRSTSGIRPHDVDDKKISLEDQLRNGFMAAYKDRIGDGSDETVEINLEGE